MNTENDLERVELEVNHEMPFNILAHLPGSTQQNNANKEKVDYNQLQYEDTIMNADDEAPGNHGKVLIVDDEPFNISGI